MRDLFDHFAAKAAHISGTYWSFLLAVGLILVWALTGPLFAFSTTWQLVINTGTTIITFLMVFLIQNTQNRDARAVQLKLDELISSITQARNKLIDIEEDSEEDLERLQDEFRRQRREVDTNGATRR